MRLPQRTSDASRDESRDTGHRIPKRLLNPGAAATHNPPLPSGSLQDIWDKSNYRPENRSVPNLFGCVARMRLIELVVTLALTLSAGIAAAEVYRWVDEDGKVHYGDRKPATGTGTRALALPPAPSRDADHAERALKQRRLLDAFDAERDERRQAETAAAAAKHEREERCAKLERDLDRFNRANIVYSRDESGARIYMSDEEREATVARAREWRDKHCDRGH